MLKLAAIAVILVANPVVFADSGDAFYVEFGPLGRDALEAAAKNPETWAEHAAGFENAAIAMTAEEVIVTLHPDYAEVDATFDFHNTSPERRDVEMCFPVSYGMLGTNAYAEREEGFTIAGREASLAITFDEKETTYVLEDKRSPLLEGEQNFLGVPAFAVWPVSFEGGARRRLVCRYQDKYSGGGGMILGDYFVYILSTGATWKGPIGKGRLVVEPAADFDWSTPLYYLTAGAPPPRDEGARVVWEFADFEPPFKADVTSADGGQYYPYAPIGFAGLCVGFMDKRTVDMGYGGSSYQVPEGPGMPAGALADGLNFRTAPDPAAPNVAAKPTFALKEPMRVFERKGEWYRVLDNDGNEGWVRWHYVDPESGKERIYVEMATNCE